MKTAFVIALPPLLLVAIALIPATLTAQTPAAAPDGAALYRQHCQSCHSMVSGEAARLGPNLAGVIGRKAAATNFAYSPALKKSGLTWTRANLDRYLAAPTRVVPGSRMFVSVPDSARRAAILDHLAHGR